MKITDETIALSIFSVFQLHYLVTNYPTINWGLSLNEWETRGRKNVQYVSPLMGNGLAENSAANLRVQLIPKDGSLIDVVESRDNPGLFRVLVENSLLDMSEDTVEKIIATFKKIQLAAEDKLKKIENLSGATKDAWEKIFLLSTALIGNLKSMLDENKLGVVQDQLSKVEISDEMGLRLLNIFDEDVNITDKESKWKTPPNSNSAEYHSVLFNSAKVADEKSKQLQMIFRGLRIDPEGKFEVFPSRSAKGMFRLVIRKDIFDGFKDETLFKQLMSYVLILQEKHAQSNPSKAEECADLLKMLEEKQKKNVKRF